MLKETITYTDFNGTERTEDFYFSITKAALIRQEMMTVEIDNEGNVISETFTDKLKRISEAENKKGSEVLPLFEDIIKMTIGIKSEDGRYFRKPAGYADDFLDSAAWSELFLKFMENPTYAAEFINKAVPADISGQDSEEYKRELARARSEAGLQGYKKKETPEKDLPEAPEESVEDKLKASRFGPAYSDAPESLETTDGLNNNPWPRRDAEPEQPLFKEPKLTESERAELEELRALRASQGAEAPRPADVIRPPHESGPGY